MEQRPPRLGDIVDDYCPRERRITNHAIVAIVEDAIRQTRCTTCDAEHVFKDGREPRKRKKEPESLYEQVLADVVTPGPAPPRIERAPAAPVVVAAPPAPQATTGPRDEEADSAAAPAPATPVIEEAWQSHRRLIRASLPKTDEPPPPRPIPEFTMYQRPQGRGGRSFRAGQGREVDGNVVGNGRDNRHGRSFQGGGHGYGGNGAGNGNGNGSGGAPGPDGARGARGRSGRRRGHHKRAR